MLKITHVSKTFNAGTITEKKALLDFNLTIEDGDFITVIGGNGAGKSTLLNLIAGVHTCDTGSIVLNGVDLTDVPEYKRAKYLGRVFQDPMMGTAGNMEIEENLAMAMRRGKRRTLGWGILNKERDLYREKLAMLDLGLEKRLKSKVGLLSGGQRQALTLLMATLQKPELLLLDEHTAALDPKTAQKVLDLTQHFVEKDHLTTFMVTHNMRHAIQYGNRLIMMLDGNVVFDVRGEEKKNLQVQDLMQKFQTAKAGDSLSDRMILN
ncbi:MAG: ABC transporter ATP-binding protein [Treponema sp.]|nr:ABC transporter ATP-binding protein [Treponema sp.]